MIINRDTVVLRVACLARLVGVNNQSQLVACLYGVVVRLEIYGIIVIYAVLQGNLISCRSGIKACARVCKVDPAACNNLVLRLDSLEVDDLIILRTTATQFILPVLTQYGSWVGRKFIVCYINEHCAHHQCIMAAGALALYCDCRCLLIRMLNRCRADLYLNSALNHRIVRYRLSGIHCTCAGRTSW